MRQSLTSAARASTRGVSLHYSENRRFFESKTSESLGVFEDSPSKMFRKSGPVSKVRVDQDEKRHDAPRHLAPERRDAGGIEPGARCGHWNSVR